MANFNGSSGNDIYTGGVDADSILGNGGNDTLSGNDGSDTIAGGAGADRIDGGDGSDTLYSGDLSPPFSQPYYNNSGTPPLLDTGSEVDTLNGGAGDDRIYAGFGDNIDGGGNGYAGDYLYISFLGAPSGVTVDFTQPTQTVGGGTITGIEYVSWVQGSNYDDNITVWNAGGYATFTAVFAGAGNDHVVADYYTGTIYGEAGDDVIDGRNSQYLMRVDGGDGNDILYTNSNTFSVADGGAGNDTIYAHGEVHGGAGNDHIILQSTYYQGPVSGDAGNDTIDAVAAGNPYGGNTISGGDGADFLNGGAHNDTLVSGNFSTTSGVTGTPADDLGLEHDVLSGGSGDDILWSGYGDDVDGGNGHDTLSLSLAGAASGVAIDLSGITGPGGYSFGGGIIQNIETLTHLTGSTYADTITVSTQTSLLTIAAGAGNDMVIASGSSVDFRGEAGNDLFVSGIAGDRFDGGSGYDTVDYGQFTSGVSVTLGANAGSEGSGPGGDVLVNVEQVEGSTYADTIAGSSLGDALLGDDGNDTLSGNAGNDTLDGGYGNDTLDGGTGADGMAGGLGNDVYYVDNPSDFVDEDNAGGGNDTVYASTNWQPTDGHYVETIIASAGGLSISGNAFGNTLIASDQGDILNGGGGADTMIGGAGGDTFWVDNSGDVITETGSGTNDEVVSSIDYTLGANLEQLILLGGSAAVSGTGNAADNAISGNALANHLNGGGGNDTLDGGSGADTMDGGTGNDTFRVDNAGDVVTEGANSGTDQVIASASWILGAGQQVETISAAAGAIVDLSGNELDNHLVASNMDTTLRGMDGNDLLDGFGGTDMLFGGNGQDTLNGNDGNDHLYGQSANGGPDGADSISGGNGIDYIQGNAGNDTLDGGAQADRINGGADDDRISGGDGSDVVNGNTGNDLIDGGAGSDSLRGGQGNDQITGGEGNDTLSGDLGADTLTGGTGIDLFRIAGSDAGTSGTAHDEITDFTHGTDHIMLPFLPLALVTSTANNAASAIATANAAMAAHAGDHEAALIQVGTDTYLFASATGTTDSAELMIKLDGVNANQIASSDFF